MSYYITELDVAEQQQQKHEQATTVIAWPQMANMNHAGRKGNRLENTQIQNYKMLDVRKTAYRSE
jgi:hypothetical protein